MGMSDKYLETMQEQLKQWDAQLDALAAQSEKASAKARTVYHAQLKELRASREAAREVFEKVRSASEAHAAQMQVGMEATWDSMQAALKKAAADLKR